MATTTNGLMTGHKRTKISEIAETDGVTTIEVDRLLRAAGWTMEQVTEFNAIRWEYYQPKWWTRANGEKCELIVVYDRGDWDV